MPEDKSTDAPAGEPEKVARRGWRRWFRDGHLWVGAIGTAVGALAAVVALLLPGVRVVGATGGTTTMTVSAVAPGTEAVSATTAVSATGSSDPPPAPSATPSAPPAPSSPGARTGQPVTAPAGATSAAPAATAVPAPAEGPERPDPAVRFAGDLPFGSFNLDYRQPRALEGRNVYRIQDARLYADDGFQLVEWPTDGAPDRAGCVAELAANGKRDATGLVPGGHVCGRTPEGRVFRIEVLDVSAEALRGRVLVWEV